MVLNFKDYLSLINACAFAAEAAEAAASVAAERPDSSRTRNLPYFFRVLIVHYVDEAADFLALCGDIHVVSSRDF